MHESWNTLKFTYHYNYNTEELSNFIMYIM